MRTIILVLLASLLACGSAASDEATTLPPSAFVACGARSCAANEACTFDEKGDTSCHARGSEPSYERGPFPSVLLYCDGNDDCAVGERCTRDRGEIERFSCRAEACDTYLAGRVCETDGDCAPCANVVLRCSPSEVSGIRVCRS